MRFRQLVAQHRDEDQIVDAEHNFHHDERTRAAHTDGSVARESRRSITVVRERKSARYSYRVIRPATGTPRNSNAVVSSRRKTRHPHSNVQESIFFGHIRG